MKNKLLLSLLTMTTLIVSSCDQVPTEQPTEQPNSEVSESATVVTTASYVYGNIKLYGTFIISRCIIIYITSIRIFKKTCQTWKSKKIK